MASFGQLTNAFLKSSQETTIGLANINFDFAILKYDAPTEYRGLGEALSKRRRETAEDGPLHITARKLGALFQGAMPKVPHLIQTYGLRASEIAKSPELNPDASARHGIFADHVGPDGSTIWAAATSGGETITVHLLACMLARIWSREEAVSIWHELVESRKLHLQEDIAGSTTGFSVADLTASRIDITRSQLDAWDASARAWLQTADAAKMLQQTQPRLVVDNVSLPISHSGSLYAAVMDASTKALQALDNLLKGAPQQVDDGAVLLGLSAWHIYPDILMANTDTYIKQADALVVSGGIITIGLENKDGRASGVFWSLPLAQAKYYGDPVVAKRHLGVGDSRVSFDGLLLVVIGNILGGWRDQSLSLDQQVDFVHRLSVAAMEGTDKPSYPKPHVNPWYSSRIGGLEWLDYLGVAASQYNKSTGISRTYMSRLISFGKRQRPDFLGPHHCRPPALFGLVDFTVLLRSLDGADERVKLLRRHSRFRYTRIGTSDHPTKKRRVTGSGRAANIVTWMDESDTVMGDLHDAFQDPDTVLTLGNRPLIPPGPGEKPTRHILLYGNDQYAAIYVPDTQGLEVLPKNLMPIPHFFRCLERGAFPAALIPRALLSMCRIRAYDEHVNCLDAVGMAAKLYSRLQGALVHLRVTSRPLFTSRWLAEVQSPSRRGLQAALSCIAYFETGELDVNPGIIGDEAFAVCMGSSIYVAERMLRDPTEVMSKATIERLVGNVGRPGVAFLITPPNPMVRKLDYSSWHMVSHDPFDGTAEDNFKGTSFHLSFTGYEIPIDLGHRGSHEHPAYFLETVISVYDCGKWIADVEILKSSARWNLVPNRSCLHDPKESNQQLSRLDLVSIDSWVELLDPPTQAAVVRAYGNPVARLAAAALALRNSKHVHVIQGHPCWVCLDIAGSCTSKQNNMVPHDQVELQDLDTSLSRTNPESGDYSEKEGEEDLEGNDAPYALPEEDTEEDSSFAFNMPIFEPQNQHQVTQVVEESVFFIY